MYGSIMKCLLRGRCTIWWGWRVFIFMPHIANDVVYVIYILIIKFILHGRSSIWWSATLMTVFFVYCKWCYIYDTDQLRNLFSVLYVIFGEVGGWFLLLCMYILNDVINEIMINYEVLFTAGYIEICCSFSSTAQSGGWCFKNRTRIGDIHCCEWWTIDQLTNLSDWLNDWLTIWLTGSLPQWLPDLLTDRLTNWWTD